VDVAVLVSSVAGSRRVDFPEAKPLWHGMYRWFSVNTKMHFRGNRSSFLQSIWVSEPQPFYIWIRIVTDKVFQDFGGSVVE
jgi:hypothetical protein